MIVSSFAHLHFIATCAGALAQQQSSPFSGLQHRRVRPTFTKKHKEYEVRNVFHFCRFAVSSKEALTDSTCVSPPAERFGWKSGQVPPIFLESEKTCPRSCPSEAILASIVRSRSMHSAFYTCRCICSSPAWSPE